VTFGPSAIVIEGPFGLGNPLLTTTTADPSTVTVSTALLDSGGSYLGPQLLAGGTSVDVVVTSSNQPVGTITSSPVTIFGGSASADTGFQPHAQGNATISANVPAGFTAPAQFGSINANVSVPGIAITDGVSVGQRLQQTGTAILGQVAPAGGLVLTITSNSPGLLVISDSPTTAGSASIQITVPAGQSSALFYLQGVGSSGTATYTASAPGYNSRTASVPLTPSGVVISGPFGVGLPFLSASIAAGGSTPIFVQMAQLDPSTNGYSNTQPLAGGQSLNISLTNSNPSVGTLVSPVTLSGGNDTAVSPFTPLTQGSTFITVTTPSGFTTSTQFTSLNAQVNP